MFPLSSKLKSKCLKTTDTLYHDKNSKRYRFHQVRMQVRCNAFHCKPDSSAGIEWTVILTVSKITDFELARGCPARNFIQVSWRSHIAPCHKNSDRVILFEEKIAFPKNDTPDWQIGRYNTLTEVQKECIKTVLQTAERFIIDFRLENTFDQIKNEVYTREDANYTDYSHTA